MREGEKERESIIGRLYACSQPCTCNYPGAGCKAPHAHNLYFIIIHLTRATSAHLCDLVAYTSGQPSLNFIQAHNSIRTNFGIALLPRVLFCSGVAQHYHVHLDIKFVCACSLAPRVERGNGPANFPLLQL